MTIKYSAKLLAAVAIAQSYDDTRYYLCGVYFEGAKAIAALRKAGAREAIFEDGVLTVTGDFDERIHIEESKEIDGTFPDYQRVIPSDTGDSAYAAFACGMLKRIVDTGKILDNSAISFKGADATSPHIVTYHNDKTVFSVLMPV